VDDKIAVFVFKANDCLVHGIAIFKIRLCPRFELHCRVHERNARGCILKLLLCQVRDDKKNEKKITLLFVLLRLILLRNSSGLRLC